MNNRATFLSLVLIALAVFCTVLAVRYRHDRNSYKKQLDDVERALESVKEVYSIDTGTASQKGKQKEPASIYDLLDLLEKKEQLITEMQKTPGLNVEAAYPSRSYGDTDIPDEYAQDPDEPVIGDISEFGQFLKVVDVSGMNDLEYSHHVSLVQQVATLQALLLRADGAEGDAIYSLVDEIERQTDTIARRLQGERNTVLYLTATQMGYDEGMARWFVEYLNYVFSMTSPTAFRGSVDGDTDIQLAPAPAEPPQPAAE